MIEEIDWRIKKEIDRDKAFSYINQAPYKGSDMLILDTCTGELESCKEKMMEKLHNWVFTYNSITKTWRACLRDYYTQLFSGNEGGVLESSSIDTLIELIIRTEGDSRKIDDLMVA